MMMAGSVPMMTGVMRVSMPPCAVLWTCGSRRSDSEQRHRTQSQRDKTKRTANATTDLIILNFILITYPNPLLGP